jgi:hypothetical protein
MDSIQQPNGTNTFFLIHNGPQVLGILEAPDAEVALAEVRLHLEAGQSYGDLGARRATPEEAVAWHLGHAIWSAKHLSDQRVWVALRLVALDFCRAYPACDPRTLERPLPQSARAPHSG